VFEHEDGGCIFLLNVSSTSARLQTSHAGREYYSMVKLFQCRIKRYTSKLYEEGDAQLCPLLTSAPGEAEVHLHVPVAMSQYLLDKRLSGSQSQSGLTISSEVKIFFLCPISSQYAVTNFIDYTKCA
jgi:hypothetical protein